jgi:hypothetical protein
MEWAGQMVVKIGLTGGGLFLRFSDTTGSKYAFDHQKDPFAYWDTVLGRNDVRGHCHEPTPIRYDGLH